jgi:hypothetical protein
MSPRPVLYLVLAMLSGCHHDALGPEATAQSSAVAAKSFSRDFGEVGQYNSCAAVPRRPLSAQEHCQIEAYRSSCTKTNDCFVSCIASPDGYRVGGGCHHICGVNPEPPDLTPCAELANGGGA